MSRAEFARALDWSPTTISRWERGKAEPSRLDFKTILAFAEERRVRYRPKPAERPAPPAPQDTGPPQTQLGWSTPPPRDTGGRRRAGLASLGIGAATLCALLLLGIPGERRQLVPPPVVHRPPVSNHAREVVEYPAPLAPIEAPPPPVAVEASREPEAPAVPLARLDAIVVIGQIRRATFRVDEESVTVDQGGRLGPERVAAIGTDRVKLVSDAGGSRVVQLGDEAALD